MIRHDREKSHTLYFIKRLLHNVKIIVSQPLRQSDKHFFILDIQQQEHVNLSSIFVFV